MGAQAPRVSRPELKNFDITAGTLTSAAGAWVGVILNDIPLGTNPSQRIGRRTNLKSLLVRWAGGPLIAASFRILIVYDNNPPNPTAVPPITDVLTANNVNGIMDLGQSERFMVLADLYPPNLHGFTNASAATVAAHADIIYKKFNLQQNYGSAAAVMTQGAIIMYLCGAGAGVATTTVAFTSRVRYTDE